VSRFMVPVRFIAAIKASQHAMHHATQGVVHASDCDSVVNCIFRVRSN